MRAPARALAKCCGWSWRASLPIAAVPLPSSPSFDPPQRREGSVSVSRGTSLASWPALLHGAIALQTLYPRGFDVSPLLMLIRLDRSDFGRYSSLKRLFSCGMVILALTLASGGTASADPGQVPSPPPATDAFSPGKACAHANLAKNRSFGASHRTGVRGGGTPPTCGPIPPA